MLPSGFGILLKRMNTTIKFEKVGIKNNPEIKFRVEFFKKDLKQMDENLCHSFCKDSYVVKFL